MTRTHAIPESDILEALDLTGVQKGASYGPWIETPSGPELVSASPNDGSEIGRVLQAGEGDYEKVMEEAGKAFLSWRMRPAPERGEVVRLLAGEFRKYKEPLGALISLEMGKVRSEGEGEVQEMIDIADFAVGLSRQLYGLT
ncbi:MAG: aldehyde dehydrogenase family protein, partial [Gemmatimonadetes bacterium]|nr:aldehyde dehydrogenase family protein [Gemmatimonadota bacterium]